VLFRSTLCSDGFILLRVIFVTYSLSIHLFSPRSLSSVCRFLTTLLRFLALVLSTASVFMICTVQSEGLSRVPGTASRCQDVLSSNLNPETVYPNCYIYGFTQSLQENYGVVSRVRLQPLPSSYLLMKELFSFMTSEQVTSPLHKPQ
jgi:hypothetical protein